MLETQRGFGEETGLRARDAVGEPRSTVPVGFAMERFCSKWLKPEAAWRGAGVGHALALLPAPGTASPVPGAALWHGQTPPETPASSQTRLRIR